MTTAEDPTNHPILFPRPIQTGPLPCRQGRSRPRDETVTRAATAATMSSAITHPSQTTSCSSWLSERMLATDTQWTRRTAIPARSRIRAAPAAVPSTGLDTPQNTTPTRMRRMPARALPVGPHAAKQTESCRKSRRHRTT